MTSGSLPLDQPLISGVAQCFGYVLLAYNTSLLTRSLIRAQQFFTSSPHEFSQ